MGTLKMASGCFSAVSSILTPPSDEAIRTGPCGNGTRVGHKYLTAAEMPGCTGGGGGAEQIPSNKAKVERLFVVYDILCRESFFKVPFPFCTFSMRKTLEASHQVI